MDKWNIRWNSSFAPIITNCTFSSDNTYIESFVKDKNNPDNIPYDGTIPTPTRSGYTFVGFSTQNNGKAEYTVKNLKDAPNGKILYTVWS